MSESRAIPFGITARRWVRDQLHDDPVLTQLGITDVYKAGNLGSDVEYPIVVIDTASRFEPVLNGEARTNMATGLVIVRAIYRTDSDEVVEPAAARIIELLEHRTQEPIDGGGLVLVCHYDGDWDFPSTTPDSEYRSLGGYFRLQIQAT